MPAAEYHRDSLIIAAREFVLALRRAQAGFRRVELSLGSNDSRFCVLFMSVFFSLGLKPTIDKDRLFFFLAY